MTIKYNFVLDGETFVCKTFDDLETLDNYHDIVYINCQGNKLTVLPTLPNSLVYLICSSNKLSVLPAALPNSLTHLHCSINLLILIPTLPNRLRYLDCEQNLLMFLPKFPDSLTYKCYNYNPVDTYIKDKYDGNLDIYHRENEIYAGKLVRWYLDCRENPIFKFCRTRLDREYDALIEEDSSGIMT